MALRYIGTITRGHGIKGDIVVGSLVKDTPALPLGTKISIGFSANFAKEFTVEKSTVTKAGMFLSLKELANVEEAETLKEQGVFVEEAKIREPEKEEFFVDEIVGCTVIDQKTKEKIGEIIDVWNMPANDVWVVQTERGEIPFPVIDDVIKKIDVKGRRVEVVVIDGLMELGEHAENDEMDNENDEDFKNAGEEE
ncbi:MAG: ribosome maturation factor RimM [Bacteroidota bacterium]